MHKYIIISIPLSSTYLHSSVHQLSFRMDMKNSVRSSGRMKREQVAWGLSKWYSLHSFDCFWQDVFTLTTTTIIILVLIIQRIYLQFDTTLHRSSIPSIDYFDWHIFPARHPLPLLLDYMSVASRDIDDSHVASTIGGRDSNARW